MIVVAILWAGFLLPMLALAPLAIERGRSPVWGVLGLASYPGMIVGLICLFAMEPGNVPERIAYGRFERGEIDADEYERIRRAVATQR